MRARVRFCRAGNRKLSTTVLLRHSQRFLSGSVPSDSREETMVKSRILSLVAIGMTLGACASGPPKTEVSSAIAAANNATEHARIDGALAAAPATMADALQKLSQAQAAAKDDERETAIRLANEAKADADLADATSQAARAEAASQAVNSDLRTLQQTTAPKPGGLP
jgi:hypothetical protein